MRWVLKNEVDVKNARKLSASLDIPVILSKILIRRGIKKPKEVRSFFYPKLKYLSDPFSLPGMEKGIERIITALRKKQKITIIGDYDADGITATSLLFLVLSEFGAQVSWYLPDRFVEGYGLSKLAIDQAQEKNNDLLLTVDCGISAFEEVDYANSLGLETIISDHHQPRSQLPDAYSVINPKLSEEKTPTTELAGVGVAFKIAEGLYQATGRSKTELYEHLDLVALGTIADIVPLQEENRILAKHGLKRIASTTKPGLKSLMKKLNLWGKKLNSGHIIFSLAPRLNAVGRIGDASAAIKLLTTHDKERARELSDFMEKENTKRKELDKTVYSEAKQLVQEEVDLQEEGVIVLAKEDWHLGVIGIVASRIAEDFYRPTILLSSDNGTAQGSARSIPTFHILNALEATEEYLDKYGGHKYAAGVSVPAEEIPNFREAINQYANEELDDSDLREKLEIDAQIKENMISKNFVEWLELFAPYGPNNMRPVFLIKDANIVPNSTKVVGENHLKFKIKTPQGKFSVIGFDDGDKIKLVRGDAPKHLVFLLEFNRYFGYPKVQLRLKDIKIGNIR